MSLYSADRLIKGKLEAKMFYSVSWKCA